MRRKINTNRIIRECFPSSEPHIGTQAIFYSYENYSCIFETLYLPETDYEIPLDFEQPVTELTYNLQNLFSKVLNINKRSELYF